MIDPVDNNDLDDPADRLRDAWQRRVASDDESIRKLISRHREKHRRYHTVDHVAAVVADVERLEAELELRDGGAVVAAAFYHDAIYEPESPANERASARLARKDLQALGWEPERIDHVVAMIEGTKTHLDPPDADGATLFDADLAILGADPHVYDGYVEAVRAEYRHISDTDWDLGRAAVLQAFLDRPNIFATAGGRQRWERSARTNIEREMTLSRRGDEGA